MSQHTPGPWKGQQHGDEYIIKSEDGSRVFSIRNGVIPMNADARLIAAAPRMLDVLSRVQSRLAGMLMSKEESQLFTEVSVILRDVEDDDD